MTEGEVESYFTTIGVGRPKSEEVFIKKGRKRFGGAFDEIFALITERAAGIKIDPYDLKNASLDLSLYIAEQYSSGVWRAFARWLVQERRLPTPQRVLDLGCENGVISCLLATVWPRAEIVAVDRSGPAISAGRELAKRLSLRNVSFEETDVRRFLARNQNMFSIVVATLAMHEVLKDPDGREPFQWNEAYVALEDVRLSQKDECAISVLREIRSSLAPSGLLISLDRSPTSATTWWYTQCLEEAGLRVSLRYSYKIEAQGPYGIVEKFPLTVTTRADEGGCKTTADEILSLASFPELSALSLTLKEDVADLFPPKPREHGNHVRGRRQVCRQQWDPNYKNT